MRFTLSHAAAALPFRKFKPVWPALVIGTFGPDLQYFVSISDEDRSGHHFPQALLFTLPFAVVVLWVFEWCVKGPVIELLPSGLQRRLQDKVEPLSFKGWGRFATIGLWVAIGIATHVLWDQFTHGRTRMTAHLPLLRHAVPVPFHAPVFVTKILQQGSTISGLLVPAAWFGVWYGRKMRGREGWWRLVPGVGRVAIVFTMTVIAAITGYPLAVARLADHPLPINQTFFVATVFEAMTLVFFVEILIYSLARTLGGRSRRAPAAQSAGPSG
jgi:hypothetical protein